MTLALICAFGFRTIILANKALERHLRMDAETFTNLLEVEEELGRKCMGIATNPEEFNSYEIAMAIAEYLLRQLVGAQPAQDLHGRLRGDAHRSSRNQRLTWSKPA